MMDKTHGKIAFRRTAAAVLASTRIAVRHLPAPRCMVRMAGSPTNQTLRARGLVLLDELPALLLGPRAKGDGHG